MFPLGTLANGALGSRLALSLIISDRSTSPNIISWCMESDSRRSRADKSCYICGTGGSKRKSSQLFAQHKSTVEITSICSDPWLCAQIFTPVCPVFIDIRKKQWYCSMPCATCMLSCMRGPRTPKQNPDQDTEYPFAPARLAIRPEVSITPATFGGQRPCPVIVTPTQYRSIHVEISLRPYCPGQ